MSSKHNIAIINSWHDPVSNSWVLAVDYDAHLPLTKKWLTDQLTGHNWIMLKDPKDPLLYIRCDDSDACLLKLKLAN